MRFKKYFQNLSNTFNLIGSILIPSALLFYVFALFRRLNNTNDPSSGGGLFGNNLGGGTHNVNLEPNTGVTFDDVAGCDESKLELTEVVDFLKNRRNLMNWVQCVQKEFY